MHATFCTFITITTVLSGTITCIATTPPLERRQNQVTCVNAGGNIEDSNNNTRFLDAYGDQTVTVNSGGDCRVVARTGSTVCEIGTSSGPDSEPQTLTGSQITEALWQINNQRGQSGRFSGYVRSNYNPIVQVSAGLG